MAVDFLRFRNVFCQPCHEIRHRWDVQRFLGYGAKLKLGNLSLRHWFLGGNGRSVIADGQGRDAHALQKFAEKDRWFASQWIGGDDGDTAPRAVDGFADLLLGD